MARAVKAAWFAGLVSAMTGRALTNRLTTAEVAPTPKLSVATAVSACAPAGAFVRTKACGATALAPQPVRRIG